MARPKTNNSALTTAISYHYQTMIGLERCFSLREGHAVLFEQDGDVSFYSELDKTSTQTEVKNYSNPLTDHHENLWKTIKNWTAPQFDASKYVGLILHTTQPFGRTSTLKDWNLKSAQERLELLKKIYKTRTKTELESKRPSDVVRFQKEVMKHEDEFLVNILEKVSIHTEESDITELKKKIKGELNGIPHSNMDSYIKGLVGFVYEKASPETWEITYEAWKAENERLTAKFCKREFTFPDFFGDSATDEQLDDYSERLFVQKIKRIELHDEIAEAIGNWIELTNSLLQDLDGSPVYRIETKKYQQGLIKDFKSQYKKACLLLDDQLKDSQVLYFDTISKDARSFQNFTPPNEYRNGLLHDAMDDESLNLNWKIEKDE